MASGHVSNVDVGVRGVDVHGLRFASITADLQGVEIDRSELIQHGRVVVDAIENGTVKAVISEKALADATGIPFHLEQGRASVTVFGRRIGADLAVRNGRLVIGGVGISLPGFDLGIHAS